MLIKPVHGLMERELYNSLVDSMRDVGWKGRPLVIMPLRNRRGFYQGLSGSHRLGASWAADLKKIPVVVLTPEESAVARASEDGWDQVRDRPAYTDAIATDLEKAGYRDVAQLIRMDVLATSVEMRRLRPWSEEALKIYREGGFDRSEVLEVMTAETWPC